VAEPEIAIHIGKDVPGGADRETARAAIVALGPAIELIDLAAMPNGPDDVEATLAGNIFQKHVVLGPRSETMAGANLTRAKGRIVRSGKEIAAPDDLESGTGPLALAVLNVANALAGYGEQLRAGQFIIGGSVVPPFFIEAGETGVRWTLEPAGTAEVTFSR
jgi:2-keto-4-pentenoate hydratase